MSAIVNNDAPIETTSGSLDEGADAFLDLWKKDAAEPSDTEENEDEREVDEETSEDPEDTDDDQETEGDDEETEDNDPDDEDDGEDDEKPKKVLKDDSVVKIKVGDEELAVPVEKLKRLYGQEAALTRKSQEVAATRRQLEETGARHVAASEALLTRAKERFEPYAKVDWLVAARELEPSELKVLRGEAQKAFDDVRYLETEIDGFMEKAKAERQSNLIVEAKKSLEELSDPEKGIKGFNQKLYGDMLGFAMAQGIPEEYVSNLVSAPILRVLHKAMLFDKGQKVVTKTTDKRPKKIIKSSANPETTREAFKPKNGQKAMTKLRDSGSVDDAANAFLAGWSN